MKQTAVEYLIEVFFKSNVEKSLFQDEINKAKEMEEEQIAKAFDCGYSNGEGGYQDNPIFHGCNYYDETFKSE